MELSIRQQAIGDTHLDIVDVRFSVNQVQAEEQVQSIEIEIEIGC